MLQNLNELCGKEIKSYEADCTNENSLNHIFQEQDIHGIIHFAAFKAVGESITNALKYHKNNVNSMVILLECMKNLE